MNTWIERKAMNIVYQICDLLEVPVDVRQKYNDTMIDFTLDILASEIQKAKEEQIEHFEKLIQEEIATAHKEGTPTSRLTSLYMAIQEKESSNN